MSNDNVTQSSTNDNSTNNFDGLKVLMAEVGLPFPEDKEIVLDDSVHRYSSRQNGEEDEWYIGSEVTAGVYAATFSSWRTDERHYWKSDPNCPIEKYERKLQEISDKVVIDMEERRAEGKRKAQSLWNNSPTAYRHPYLERKKLPAKGLKAFSNFLLIPCYDGDGVLCNVQRIDAHGTKRFLKGSSGKGLSLTLGDLSQASSCFVCEGYATGASIFESTSIPVAVAFSACNTSLVGKMLQNKYPDLKLILAGDHDEAGAKSASSWKNYIGANVVFPPNTGDDFSDLFILKGKQAVSRAVLTKKVKSRNIFQILSEEIIEPPKFTDLVYGGKTGVIYGAPGLGKSFIALEMGFCMATGLDFLGFKTLKKAKVLLIDGELSEWEIKQRLGFLDKRYNDVECVSDNFKVITRSTFEEMTEEGIDLFQEEHKELLHEHIAEADVVFFDNYGSLTSPLTGDNYKQDVVEWAKFQRWIHGYREDGSSSLIVMHPTKEQGGRRLAGPAKIEQSVDFMMLLSKVKERDPKAFLHVKIELPKCRYLPYALQESRSVKLMLEEDKNRGWDDGLGTIFDRCL